MSPRPVVHESLGTKHYGWKAVGVVMQCSAKTAYRASKAEPPLPRLRVGRVAGRVYSTDKWINEYEAEWAARKAA